MMLDGKPRACQRAAGSASSSAVSVVGGGSVPSGSLTSARIAALSRPASSTTVHSVSGPARSSNVDLAQARAANVPMVEPVTKPG